MDRKHPIGLYQQPDTIDDEQVRIWTEELARVPEKLEQVLEETPEQVLETPYREKGWTRIQVAHHIADACMNGYIRFKWALTEDNPQIKPYEEDLWARMEDEGPDQLEISLSLLHSIIDRWTVLLRSMTRSEFERTFVHPVSGKERLDEHLGFCVWHCRHHLAQIELEQEH